MSDVVDSLELKISAEAGKAESSIDKLIAQLDSLNNRLGTVGTNADNIGEIAEETKKTKKGFSGASSSISNLTLNLSKLYFGIKALKNAFKGFGASISSAMDFVETSNYWSVSLNKAFGQITEQFGEMGAESAEAYKTMLLAGMEDINKKLTGYMLGDSGEALSSGRVGLGVSIEKLMDFQARVTGITSAVGMLGETSVETTKFLSMLASDLSSLTNTDISTVYNNLISTLIGQSRAGYKYGFDTTNNTLQQIANELGIDKAVSEMEQFEKMQLRVVALLQQSDIAWADMANTVDSVANQYRIFGEQTENLSRTFGNLFLPIVQNALPWINGATIALNNLLTTLGYQMFGNTWLEDLQNGISSGTANDLGDLEDVLGEATDASEKLQKSLRGFDELKTISGGSDSVINSLIGANNSVDLTDIISAGLGDYESLWNEAFANIESQSEKIAENLTEKFGDVADTFERLLPAITGVGSALITYEIAGKVGKLVTALGKLSGPAAGIAIGSGLLIGLATAIGQVRSELKTADLETRFGDITLSAKELEEVAKNIIDNKNLEKISKLLSEIGEAADIKSEIQDSVDTLNKLNWKVSIGMELTEEEQGKYKETITKYIDSVMQYVEQNQYAANVGLELFLMSEETGGEITATVNAFYESVRGTLQELGERLNKVTTDAWNDGLLTIDEAKAITEIQSQMAEIEKTLATSEYTARMQLLELQFDGANLNAETYKKLVAERDKLIQEYSDSLDESLVYTLAQVNLAYQTTYGEASTEEAKRKIKEEWDNAKKALTLGKNEQVGQMQLNALGFDLNTLSKTFGNEFDKVLPELMEKIEKGTDVFGNAFNGQKLDPNAVRTSISNLVDMYSTDLAKELGPEVVANISDLMELMEPGKNRLEQLAQSYFDETGKIPEGIADALSSIYALEAIGMSKESLLNAMLIEADTDKKAKAVLSAMEALGIETALSYKAALELKTPVVNEAVTTFMDSIVTNLNEYNSTLFKSAGENAASSFIDGFKELFPSSGNYVPIDTSKFDSSWQSNLPKINTTTQSFPGVPLSENALKEFQAAMREQVEFGLKVYIEPNEKEFAKVAIDYINQKTMATGKTPIALQY